MKRLCINGMVGAPPCRTQAEVYRDTAARYRNLARCAPNHDEAQDCLRLADTAESLARSVEREQRKPTRRQLCVGCGVYYADPPSTLCPGCEAYQEHTA